MVAAADCRGRQIPGAFARPLTWPPPPPAGFWSLPLPAGHRSGHAATPALMTCRYASSDASSGSPAITARRMPACSAQVARANSIPKPRNRGALRSRSVRIRSASTRLWPASARPAWKASFSPGSSATWPAAIASVPRARMASSCPSTAGSRRRAASLALAPSSVARTSSNSSASCGDSDATTAPRRAVTSISPSEASVRIASRIGLRETPNSSASRSSINRSPGLKWPDRMAARISSATLSRNGECSSPSRRSDAGEGCVGADTGTSNRASGGQSSGGRPSGGKWLGGSGYKTGRSRGNAYLSCRFVAVPRGGCKSAGQTFPA